MNTSRIRNFKSAEAMAAHLALESRALGLPTGQGSKTASGLIKSLIDGGKLRSKCSVRILPASDQVCEVFTLPALPVASAPGAAGISADTTAALVGVTMQLKAFVLPLPVSRGALLSTDILVEMQGVLDRLYGAVVDKFILTGTGASGGPLGVFTADPTGVSTSSDLACGASGSPKLADLAAAVTAILTAGANLETSALLMHPLIYRAALADSTAGFAELKTEMLIRNSLLGVPVVLSSYCPTALTAGSYTAVAGDFSSYALGLASEVSFDLIHVAGSDNGVVQACAYMNGRPMLGASFSRLKAV